MIDPAILWKDYTYHSGQTQAIVKHFESVAGAILERYHPAAGDLVVDIGSNDGSLLRPFQRAGMRVLGVDPAEQIAAKSPTVIRAAKESLNGIDLWDVKRSYRFEQGFTFELNLAGVSDEHRDAFAGTKKGSEK